MTRLLMAAIVAIAPLAAQSVVSARAGVIYTVQGTVTITGQPVHIAPDVPLPQLQPGQALESTRGHAEVLLGQDAVLWTGNQTEIRLDSDNVDGPHLSLLAGAAILELKHTRPDRHIFIDLGSQTPEISAAGVYRFDRNPDRVRVWSGSLIPNQPFDKHDKDDLHYFAAYRSLALEQESGRFEHWKLIGNGRYTLEQRKVRSREPLKRTLVAGDLKHSGFDLELSLPISAARAKYVVASEAGLVNAAEGLLRTGPNTIESTDQRIEVFLGLGVTARLNQDSRFTIIDTLTTAPIIALEKGELMIEVAKSAQNTRLILHVGDDLTELHKPGVYRFDRSSSAPLHAVPLRAAKHADEFFNWNAHRSLEVWLSDASFMADWQRLAVNNRVRHKQFGEANLGSSVPVHVPTQLPSVPIHPPPLKR